MKLYITVGEHARLKRMRKHVRQSDYDLTQARISQLENDDTPYGLVTVSDLEYAKIIRKRFNLTHAAIAKAWGVSRYTIWKREQKADKEYIDYLRTYGGVG